MNEKLNRTEAAKYLGVSTETLRRWEIEGKGPKLYRLSSRNLYYLVSDIHDWVETKCVTPDDAYSEHKTNSEAARPA